MSSHFFTGCIAGIAVVLACLVGVAPGQSNRSLDVQQANTISFYGLGGPWVLEYPSVINTADQDRRLRVVLSSTDAEGRAIDFASTATVPAGWTRRLRLAARPNYLQRDEVTIGGRQKAYAQYLLFDADSNERIHTLQHSFLLLNEEAGIVAVVEDPNLTLSPSYDNPEFLRKATDHPLGKVDTVQLNSHYLPDVWFGLDRVDLLVISTIDLVRMRASQHQAILNWVRHGGTMLITASTQTPEILSGLLGLQAGVLATETYQTNEVILRTRGQTDTVTLPFAMPTVVLRPTDAEVVAWMDNDLPLLTHRACGDGHVMVSALPLRALQGEAFNSFWYRVSREATAGPAIASSQFAQPEAQLQGRSPGHDMLRAFAGRPAPLPSLPAGVLLGLAGLVLVGGIVLRRIRRGELIWAVLLPVSLVGAVGLWIWGTARTEPERLTTISLITGLGDGHVRIQEYHSYYSGPQSRNLVFDTGSDNGTIRHVGRRDMISQLVLRTGEQLELANLDVPVNSNKSFYTDTVKRIEGLDASLTFDNGLAGEIRNRLGTEIVSAVLYYNRRTFPLGDLPAGQATSVSVAAEIEPEYIEFIRLPGQSPRAEGNFTGLAVHQYTSAKRNELLGRLVNVPGNRPVANRPYLIGYVNRSLLTPLEGRGLARRGWGVVAWPLEFSAPEGPAPSRVTIPMGITDVAYDARGSFIYNATAEQFQDVNRPDSIDIGLSAPGDLQQAVTETHSAQLRVQLENAVNLRLVVLGLADGGPVELASIDRPEKETIPIPDAARFASDRGEVRLRLDVQALTDEPITIENPIRWKFNRVDASLDVTMQGGQNQ